MRNRYFVTGALVLAILGTCLGMRMEVWAENPFLPLWERVPDGEPRVFEDPVSGEERIYLYGSMTPVIKPIAAMNM